MKEDHTRFVYIDLLRGWALIVMIEVHIFNAFILPELKETDWFQFLNFINGLVAPSFLFVSGFAFIISSERKIDELRKFGKYFRNKLSRIGLIFIAGYSLHVPFFSFSRIVSKTPYDQLISWFNVDILQCIAAGLLLLLIMRIFIKRDGLFYGFLIAITILISLISPLVWETDFGKYLPVFFADYFNPLYGSFFPLFPWLFFLFSGAVFSRYYIISRNEKREGDFIKKLFLFSLIPVFLGHFFSSSLSILPVFNVRPNPLFLYQRLGYIFILTSFFWYYFNKRKTERSFVLDVSRESLLVYWLHLEIIYSKIWSGKSLEEIINKGFTVTECIAATMGLIVLMVIVSKIWGDFKRIHPVLIKPIVGTVIFLAALVFILI